MTLDVAIATSRELADLLPEERPLVDALERRGLEVSPAVWDDETFDWSEPRFVLVRSTWDYFFRCEEFLRWADEAAAKTAFWNPPETLRWNSDKTYLRELEGKGIRTVPTLWLERGQQIDLGSELRARGWHSAVVKPAVDGGAKRLVRVGTGGVDIGAAEERTAGLLAGGGVLVQPFLDSIVEAGELSIFFVDGRLTHAVRKRAATGDFRVQPEWGGSYERVEPPSAAMSAAEAALAEVAHPALYARVDLVEPDSERPMLIEVEMIEPRLFLDAAPHVADVLADAIVARLT